MKRNLFLFGLVLIYLISFANAQWQTYDDFSSYTSHSNPNSSLWTFSSISGTCSNWVQTYDGQVRLSPDTSAGSNCSVIAKGTFNTNMSSGVSIKTYSSFWGSSGDYITLGSTQLLSREDMQKNATLTFNITRVNATSLNVSYENGTVIRTVDFSLVDTGALQYRYDYSLGNGLYAWNYVNYDQTPFAGTATNINVSLISPNNSQVLIDSGTNFTGNFNITGTNTFNYSWANATYYVWNSSNYVVNTTFVSLIGNNTNYTQFIDDFVLGDYYWNIRAYYFNNTYSNFTSAPKNYTFSLGATISNQLYNNLTYETSSELFSIDVNLLTGSQVALAKLVYNNTIYTISNIAQNGDMIKLTKIIDIPLNSNISNQTNTFYWQFVYNGGAVQTLPSNTQIVNSIQLINCNTTYSTQSLNFTFFDEKNQTYLDATSNPTSILLNFKYWLGEGSIKKLYTFQQLNSLNNSFRFCLYPNSTLYTDMDMQYYTASGYAERNYYLRNYSINNISNDILLYGILTTEATKFSTIVKSSSDAFTNAVVSISKYFVGLGTYKVIMIGLTDDKGQFSANLDLDQNYNFSVVREGVDYGSYQKQATCAVAPCEINIQLSSEIIDILDPWNNYIAQNVNYSLTYNDTSKIVTLVFLDKLGTAQYWRLYVHKSNLNNDTITSICDEKSYSVAGTLTCNVSAYGGDIKADVFISRSPEKLVTFINFLNENYSDVLGASGILASIIIILVVVLSGIRNPVNALILVPFAMVILKFIHFLPLSWTWIVGLSAFILIIAFKVKT